VEAHEVRENTATTAMFFGFLVLLMVDVLSCLVLPRRATLGPRGS
jgi:hypothetical protein